MFSEHTQWTSLPCYYVAAGDHSRLVLLAGPYRTAAEAETIRLAAQRWALSASGDAAADYRYTIHAAQNGHRSSILGELKPGAEHGLGRFDGFDEPCRHRREDGPSERCCDEVCAPEDAEVWTLYGRLPADNVEPIGDFASREHAEDAFQRMTGVRYAG